METVLIVEGLHTSILIRRGVCCLLLLHGTVVVHEDESTLILWVDIALGALVART